MRAVSLVGVRFERLLVEARGENVRNKATWICVCDCGARRVVAGYALRSAKTKSCGCHSRDVARARQFRHGLHKSSEYNIWRHMRGRCQNPRNAVWHRYGGRGIAVCERWLSFENFIADMGPRPPDTSLDRIDNDGDYEPDNCRWATRTQQMNNTEKTVYVDGRPVREVAREVGMSPVLLWSRLRSGWSLERAVATPPRSGGSKK